MESGYDFVWRRGEAPYFVTPAKNIVKLHVCGNIPYLLPGDSICQPNKVVNTDLAVRGREGIGLDHPFTSKESSLYAYRYDEIPSAREGIHGRQEDGWSV